MIEILSDHQNLMYFQTAQTLNCCQAWWSLYLSRFDYSSPIELADIQPSQTPYPDVLTTKLKGTTMGIRSCSHWSDLPPNLMMCQMNT